MNGVATTSQSNCRVLDELDQCSDHNSSDSDFHLVMYCNCIIIEFCIMIKILIIRLVHLQECVSTKDGGADKDAQRLRLLDN